MCYQWPLITWHTRHTWYMDHSVYALAGILTCCKHIALWVPYRVALSIDTAFKKMLNAMFMLAYFSFTWQQMMETVIRIAHRFK